MSDTIPYNITNSRCRTCGQKCNVNGNLFYLPDDKNELNSVKKKIAYLYEVLRCNQNKDIELWRILKNNLHNTSSQYFYIKNEETRLLKKLNHKPTLIELINDTWKIQELKGVF